MRKKEVVGRLKSLAHNVADSDSVHLAMDSAFAEQMKALGLEDIVESRVIHWEIRVEINGVLYEGKKGSCEWKRRDY